jgi:hypothetical protein
MISDKMANGVMKQIILKPPKYKKSLKIGVLSIKMEEGRWKFGWK